MEGVISQTIEVLKAFFTALPAAEKATVSQLAQTVFLKNPGDWIPENRDLGQNNGQEGEQEQEDEEQEDEENTVVNGEDAQACQDDLHGEEVPGFTPTPPRSPRNSI